MADNIIGIVLQLIDEFSKPLDTVKKKVHDLRDPADRASASLDGVKAAWGNLAALGVGGLTIGAALIEVWKASTEAQNALVELEGNIRRFGEQSGVTKDRVLELSGSIQDYSRFSDEAAQSAAGTLLYFGLQNDEFERAASLLPDLAQVMGTDLAGASYLLGRAILDPTSAMRELRQVGISFNEEQRKTIKYLNDTGQEAKVASIIFEMLEEKSKGAAKEGLQTFGGALERLKNKLGDEAEFVGGMNALTRSINAATDALFRLNDTKFSPEIQAFLKKADSSAIGSLASSSFRFSASLLGFGSADEDPNRKGPGARRGAGSVSAEQRLNKLNAERVLAEESEKLAEDAKKRAADTAKKYAQARLDAIAAASRAEFELQNRIADTNILLAEQARQLAEATDIDNFAPVQDEMRRLRNEPDRPLAEGTEWKKQVDARRAETERDAAETARSIGDSFRNAISQGGYEGFTTVREILKQTLRNMVADIIGSGITNALTKVFTDAFNKIGSGSGGGSGGFLGGLLKGIGALFGFGAAGGGLITRPTIVGEEGRELAVPVGSMQIFNKRQLAGMMGMGSVGGVPVVINSNPQVVVNGDVSEKNQAMILAAMEQTHARSMREMVRTLERNGLRRPI